MATIADLIMANNPTPQRPIQAYMAGQQFGQQRQMANLQNQTGQLQLQEMQKSVEDKQKLSDLMQKHVKTGPDGTPALDQQGLIQDAYANGLPEQAQAMQKNLLETQHMQAQTQAEQLKASVAKMDEATRVLGTATNEQDFQQKAASLVAKYPDTAQVIPKSMAEMYAPDANGNTWMTKTLDGKTQAELGMKKLEMQIQMRGQNMTQGTALAGQAETQRHNRTDEQLKLQAQNPLGIPLNNGTPQGASGQAVLSALPAQTAAQVKALAEGRMQFPGGFALKSPYWQNMISLVSQYDPSFDAVNYNARSKTRNDFTSGKSAQTINAGNTVMQHLGQLSDQAETLKNTNFPAYNTLANAVASGTGDPRIKSFDITRKAVVDELTRFYRGVGGSESDITEWTRQLNNSGSPDQLHSAIGQITGLIDSKINALQDQYKQGMGSSEQGISLVSPKAQVAKQRIMQRVGSSVPAESQPSAGWSIQKVQ